MGNSDETRWTLSLTGGENRGHQYTLTWGRERCVWDHWSSNISRWPSHARITMWHPIVMCHPVTVETWSRYTTQSTLETSCGVSGGVSIQKSKSHLPTPFGEASYSVWVFPPFKKGLTRESSRVRSRKLEKSPVDFPLVQFVPYSPLYSIPPDWPSSVQIPFGPPPLPQVGDQTDPVTTCCLLFPTGLPQETQPLLGLMYCFGEINLADTDCFIPLFFHQSGVLHFGGFPVRGTTQVSNHLYQSNPDKVSTCGL